MAIICTTIPALSPLFSKERRTRNTTYNRTGTKTRQSQAKDGFKMYGDGLNGSYHQTISGASNTDDAAPLVPLNEIGKHTNFTVTRADATAGSDS
jgi:hypothetical protein